MIATPTPKAIVSRTVDPRRSLLAGVIAASGVIAAMFFGTAVAHAIPESTIKSECADAGGQYGTSTDKAGNRYSVCTYTDESGDKYTDNYINGNYSSTFGPDVRGQMKPVPRPTQLLPLQATAQAHPAAPGATP